MRGGGIPTNNPIITTHAALSGLTTGDDHTQYVYASPASSVRNVITSQGATVVPFIVKGHASQSGSLQEWRNSSDVALAQIAAGGNTTITPITALTNTVNDGLIIGHNSSGTPAASYGTGILIRGKSSTTDSRDMARIRAIWTTATDASRVAKIIFSTFAITTEINAVEIRGSATQGTTLQIGSSESIAANDEFCRLDFWSNDSSAAANRLAAAIRARSGSVGGWSTANQRADLVFYTIENETIGATEKMALTGAGNLGIATNAPTAKLDINSDTLRLRTAKTPASAAAAGNAGDICWDSSYLYICIANATWRRVAHASW